MYPLRQYSAGKVDVIGTVYIRYSQDCGIRPVVLRNFPADGVTVLVCFHSDTKYTSFSGTVVARVVLLY